MGQIWDKFQPALDLADAAWDALCALVLYIAPAGFATFELVGAFARSGHLVAAWLTVAVVFVVGVAVARTIQPARSTWAGRRLNQLRSAFHASVVKARWFVRDTTIVLAVMWITSVVLLVVLEDTNVLAVASRQMPVNPGGVDREALTAGNAAQILGMFTVMLPALLILLIAAGALHRPARRTES